MEREASEPYSAHHDPASAEPLRRIDDGATFGPPPHGTARQPPRHPVRARIHTYVTQHPGAHMGDLVRELRLGWGNAHHHLDHMERKAQIVREPEGNRVRLFVPGQVPPALRHAYAVLKNECLRDTFRAVVERPGIIQRDVAAALGVTPTAARKHLRRLNDEGLIRTERAGNRVRYRAAADAIGLEVRLWMRYGRLGEASPKREHPNDAVAEAEPAPADGPETARFDGTHDVGRARPDGADAREAPAHPAPAERRDPDERATDGGPARRRADATTDATTDAGH